MRIIITILPLLLLTAIAYTQALPLHFASYAWQLCVDPEEGLVITTRAGEVAFAPSINDYWRMSPPQKNSSTLFISGLTLDQANFFNSDTGFVSGFLLGEKGKYNIIYHTIDKGKNWQPIDFGQDGWVDDAVNLDNGEAWLSVGGSGLAYTNNYGFDWRKIALPEKKQRYTQIFFNAQRQGIIGSLWNSLAYTADNGASWNMLPTPLDQHKYNKTNKEERPALNAVAIYKNYLLVQQEDLVFYTHRDSINWILMPEYRSFFTDAANTALFFCNRKNIFLRANDALQPTAQIPYTVSAYTASCRNASLFIFSGSQLLQIKPDNSTISKNAYSDDPGKLVPTYIGSFNGLLYGHTGNILYTQKGFDEKWELYKQLPFAVEGGSLSVAEDERIVYATGNDSLIYYQVRTEQVHRTTMAHLLASFCKSTIAQISFQQGSQGCFHNSAFQRVYTLDGDEYLFDETASVAQNSNRTFLQKKSLLEALPGPDEPIEASRVTNFLDKLPAAIGSLSSIPDLKFTTLDYEQCRKDIRDFQSQSTANKKKKIETVFQLYENNIDFERLIALVDSITLLTPEELFTYIATVEQFTSTTTNWRQLSLVNKAGESLQFTHSYATDKPHLYNLPWRVTIDGATTMTSNIDITAFIQQVFPTFIQTMDKQELLNHIVGKMYREQ